MDELYLGSNTITDFNTPLDCLGLEGLTSILFFNMDTQHFNEDEYYVFDLHQRLNIKDISLVWNKPSIDRDANFDEYIMPKYE